MTIQRTLIIRIVGECDDGGIRQSERQLIPELKLLGVDVVGVVVGSSLGNYSDQKEDFLFFVPMSEIGYKGGIYSKTKALMQNRKESLIASQKIFTILKTKYCIDDYERIVINTRRVNLVPIAYGLTKYLNASVTFHIGRFYENSFFNKAYYFYLKHLPKLKIIANSHATASYYGVPASDVVFPGISPSRLSKPLSTQSLREELGIGPDSPVFLFLGRIDYGKAPDMLVQAFLSSLSVKAAGAHLVIVGPTQNNSVFDRILELKREYDTDGVIHLVGQQSDVASWFQFADVFVNSQRGYEGFGISIVEAMYCEKPVLSSALGGPSETILDNVTGWLVFDLTVDGYRLGIEKALKERDKWKQMGLLAKQRANFYTAAKQAKKYIEIVSR